MISLKGFSNKWKNKEIYNYWYYSLINLKFYSLLINAINLLRHKEYKYLFNYLSEETIEEFAQI